MPTAPTRDEEKIFWNEGHDIVVGVDEVGRGSWAGPLTVGAAVIPKDRRIYNVRDSKQITEKNREALYGRVAQWCEHWAVGHASNEECDALGMSAAQKLAAQRAIDGLGVTPDAYLLDGRWNFVDHQCVRTIVKGDTKCLSIAAASILAKVTRDRLMRSHGETYPAFDFASNKGYPSPKHRQTLAKVGPTPLHRVSWSFMDKLPIDLREPKPSNTNLV